MLGLALKVPDSQAGFVKKLTLAVDLVTGIFRRGRTQRTVTPRRPGGKAVATWRKHVSVGMSSELVRGDQREVPAHSTGWEARGRCSSGRQQMFLWCPHKSRCIFPGQCK